MFSKSRFYWNQWVSTGWSDCRNKTTHTWDVWDFLLLLCVWNLRFLVGGFSQASCCPQSRTTLLAALKFPWLFPRRAAPRRGLAARGRNPFCLLPWRFWCQHQSPVPASPVPDVFLVVLGWIQPQTEPPPALGLQDQHWRQCSVFAGEGTSSSRSSPHWSCILGHPMFSLAFPPTGQGFPSMLFPSTPLSPAVMLAASFALLSSAFHTDLFFTRGALLRGSLLCQSWALPSEPSRKELSLLKVCREGSSCSGESGLTFLLLRRAILSTLHLCSPPASVCKSKKFF